MNVSILAMKVLSVALAALGLVILFTPGLGGLGDGSRTTLAMALIVLSIVTTVLGRRRAQP